MQLYDILPCQIILATGQPGFALNYPLYVEHLTRELQLPILNLKCVTRSVIQNGTSQTQSDECSIMRLPVLRSHKKGQNLKQVLAIWTQSKTRKDNSCIAVDKEVDYYMQ